MIEFFQCGDRLYTSESDVYRQNNRRQILPYKNGPRAERVKIRHDKSYFNAGLMHETLTQHGKNLIELNSW